MQQKMPRLHRIDTVKWMTNTAIIYKDLDWDEYRVRLFRAGAYVAGADYHTDDPCDAHHTANRMIGLTAREQ